MRFLAIRALAISAFASLAILSSAQAPLHLRLANELINDIHTQALNGVLNDEFGNPLNLYGGSYPDTYVKLKRDGNEYASCFARCNSFVNRILERSYNWNWKALCGSASPSATMYVDLIKNGVGFTQVPNFTSILPGDILAIDYGPVPPGAATGHVMIVKQVDWATPATYQGMNVYWVTVCDSSSGTHSNDTRLLPGKIQTSGAGRGVIGVRVDGNGQIQGYFWSKSMSANSYHAQANREMVIGRLNLSQP